MMSEPVVQNKNILLSLAALFFGVAVSAVVFAYSDRSVIANGSVFLILMAIIFCATCLIPFAIAAGAGRLNAFEPIYLLSLVYMLYFGVRAIQIVFEPDTIWFQSLSQVDQGFFTLALAYAMFGMIAFYAGYYRGRGTADFSVPTRAIPERGSKDFPLGKFIFLLVLSWGQRLRILLAGEFRAGFVAAAPLTKKESGPFNFVGGMFENLPPFLLTMVAFALVQKRGNRKGLFLLFLLLLASEILYGILSGVKGALVQILVILLMVSIYSNPRRIGPRILAGGSIVVLVIFPLMSAYRATYSSLQAEYLSVDSEVLSSQRRAVWDQLAENFSISESIQDVMARAYGVDALAVAIKKHTNGDRDFVYGRSYMVSFFRILPRFLFPFRPEEELNFAYDYVGYPSGFNVVIQIPVMTEAYINADILGVILIMFVLGLVISKIYNHLIAKGQYPYLALYVIILAHIIVIEHSVMTIYVNFLIKQGGFSYLVAYWMSHSGSLLVHRNE